ncbi:TonB-dependent receptor [Sphingobium yanoikuyae]|uniref:TonB-dependent receptor n=1 Tax=Sphingobium yanoikuyae TaxID=13690 RepID=A0A085JZL0_SPHYA|nr:TonB-dependent receptor [Sphingobium yanoikuyae]AYO78109.1 TonB-dependent receptor [Sphingobium yanoikuyae]KFD25906.1 TonB-dependent receptor [Sphingobium yanoikuyae]KZC82676.1 TonB-dependent receptor [Sphingobium yanoikuyae]MDV3479970.1 TonB-dependent receptor [Sphingobium yanoikuyae]
MILSAPALAQAPAADAAAADAAAAEAEQGLGEIVVTATRSAQSIQKVPISMQALGAEKLQERQVKGLSDFAALLPSVSFEGIGPGRNTAFFRGIVPAGGAYASVGYYLDDMPITGTEVPDIHAYDLERVEALSGPQGTLYGAGSLAGTIRLITNKPKLDKFEFGYDVEANKYGKGDFGGQLESYINVPLAPTLAVRAMGYYRRDGGYIDNTPNNGTFNDGSSSTLTLGDNNPNTSYTLDNSDIAKDDYNTIREFGGRFQLLWQPTEGWDITPEITAQKQVARGYFGYDPRVGDLEVHDYDQTKNDDRWYQAALSIHGHIGDWDIVSATGYFKRRTRTLNDYTYYTVTYDGFGPGYESYLQFFDNCTGSGASQQCQMINPTQYYHADTHRNKFTQELRISTPKDWPFDVTVGGFYQRQKNELNTSYAIRGLDTITGYTATGGGDVAGGLIGVPAMYGIAYDEDGNPYFDTSDVINANGNPLGTMILGTQAVKGDAFYYVEQDQLYHDKAIFAEGHYNITPTLKLTGGIRYFWTDYKVRGFAGVAGSAAGVGCTTPLPDDERLTCVNTNPNAADGTGRYKEDGETHKVALDWQFQPDKMVYFNYSTGFRPGGFNRPLRIRSLGKIVNVAPFKSETLTNFEIGVKTTWNNIFRFNAAVYYEKWNNIQYGVVVSGAQGAGMTGNAGKAEVKGIEYDADLRLGKVTISTSGAFNDAKLKGDFCNFALNTETESIAQLSSCTLGEFVEGSSPPTPQVAAANGTRLPRQPRFKGTTSVRYDTDLGDYAAYIQGAALYQTGATQDLNVESNELLGNTKGFVSFDFSGGIKKDNWSVTLFLQNAFDKRGQLTRNTFCSIDFCANSSRTFTIKPQFFGIRFGQKF